MRKTWTCVLLLFLGLLVPVSSLAYASPVEPMHRKWCNVEENGKVVKQVPLGTRQTLKNGAVEQCVHGKWVQENQPASTSHNIEPAVILVFATLVLLSVALVVGWARKK
jgi:hypothetical protein